MLSTIFFFCVNSVRSVFGTQITIFGGSQPWPILARPGPSWRIPFPARPRSPWFILGPRLAKAGASQGWGQAQGRLGPGAGPPRATAFQIVLKEPAEYQGLASKALSNTDDPEKQKELMDTYHAAGLHKQ